MSGTGTDGTTASASSVAPSTGNTGVSSSLYLFTFLITILVLGLISAALLLRAYYVRRQFQRRVEAAIRAGQPLPEDAAQALGLVRPRRKNEKKVGPMPGLWESEMYIDRKADEVGDEEKGWAHLTPVSIMHYPPPREPTPPPELPLILPPRRNLMRETIALFRSEPARPQLQRLETSTSMRPLAPALTVPNPGEEVTVGVLISLPFEERVGEDRWVGEEGEEGVVPEVCLGVMGCRIDEI
ncbi:hypothetical protein JCM24511_00242 [Saitozyma sp. JCM 24511]|nr:hypothetical protein JCM24511_00242 [Saitozyma sp. JCM 24511]